MANLREYMAYKKKAVTQLGKGRCAFCGVALSLSQNTDERSSTIDHIHPKSLGGSDAMCNLVVCCKKCNTMKTNLSLYEMHLIRSGKCSINQLLTRRNRRINSERNSS